MCIWTPRVKKFWVVCKHEDTFVFLWWRITLLLFNARKIPFVNLSSVASAWDTRDLNKVVPIKVATRFTVVPFEKQNEYKQKVKVMYFSNFFLDGWADETDHEQSWTWNSLEKLVPHCNKWSFKHRLMPEAYSCIQFSFSEIFSKHHLTVRGQDLQKSCTSAETSPPHPGPWHSGGVLSGCIQPIVPWDWSPWWCDPRGWNLKRDGAGTCPMSPGPRSPARARRRSLNGGSWCGGCARVDLEGEVLLWPVSPWKSPESLGRLSQNVEAHLSKHLTHFGMHAVGKLPSQVKQKHFKGDAGLIFWPSLQRVKYHPKTENLDRRRMDG